MEICNKCKSKNITIDNNYRFHDIYNCNDCHYWTYLKINTCCRDPFKIIVIDRKDFDLYFIREQCINCGGCMDKHKPLSKKSYLDKIRGELNEYRVQDRKEIYDQEKEIIVSLKKDYNYYNSSSYKYFLYLTSETWKKKRQAIHDRDNNICRICANEASTEVHHLTYKNIYNEPLEDLIAVCNTCHKKEHNKPTIEQINQGYDHEASI
jgi:hypothetical protein